MRRPFHHAVLSHALALASVLLASSPAGAQSASPGARPDEDQFSLMKLLAEHELHDIEEESWNAYGQFTYISSWKKRFPAPYTNANGSINSLIPDPERSFTGTATLYLGVRLWKGGEAYVVPEVISERGLSQLRGLGGAIQNFELQKGGTPAPQLYRSRAYMRQTFGFGGQKVKKESGPLQLGTAYDSRRLVLTAGNFSILDFFDKNAFDIDPRQGLLSLAFLTHPAYDFASDARGYSWGGVAEVYWDDWAVRFGRITPPKDPNQLPVDFRLGRHYGDQVELEHKHRLFGQDGTVRVLAYRNHENIGRFSDAIAAFQADPLKNATTCPGFNYGSGNANAPDLCWVREPAAKVGIGLFGEQYIAHDFGVFSRAMVSDGRTEVDAYTSTDRSASVGALAKGALWSRPADVSGAAVNFGWISQAHAEYLRLGGIDGFIGDGSIRPGVERTIDVFYSVNLLKSLWLSGDYQHIVNPAFNADRGPVNIFSARVHVEF
jgi:high affinity Mn2+ porin